MKDSLIACDNPEESIILDGNGSRTISSIINANKVFGIKSLTIIFQQFHNERAIFQAEHLGLNYNGLHTYNAPMPSTTNSWIGIRKYLARGRMLFDLVREDINSIHYR